MPVNSNNNKSFNGPERRRGLHELADQIHCLRDEFQEISKQAFKRLDSLEAWQEEASPVVSAIRRAAWVVSGASLVIAILGGFVVWIWMEDHKLLKNTAQLVIQLAERDDQNGETFNRHERVLEQLLRDHMRATGRDRERDRERDNEGRGR